MLLYFEVHCIIIINIVKRIDFNLLDSIRKQIWTFGAASPCAQLLLCNEISSFVMHL